MLRIILACLLAIVLPVSAATLHVGRTMVQTITASNGVAIPPGAVSAVPVNPAVVSATVNSADNKVTLACLTVGSSNITYSAAGHNPASAMASCLAAPVPTLVVTDGPEI